MPTNSDLTRRDALSLLLGAGASALAFGCGGNGERGSGATADDGATCAETPEGEIGPYFADDSDTRFNRSNVLANIDGTSAQTGILLTLTVTVLDSEKGCAPYENAQIDIWSCNPAGVYSDQATESTSTETWLRGYQMTDSNGQVTFVTLVPGWYAGRTTHVHLRIRSTYSDASSTSDGTNTTQLFFEQTLIDTLASNVPPYDAEGLNPTTNATDRVYASQTDGANALRLTGNATSGYAAAVTLHLPIAAATSTAAGPEAGAPPGVSGGP